MKVAIIGSRESDITAQFIWKHVPKECHEIVSGGSRGIDKLAECLAQKHKIVFTCFSPNYIIYGKVAPLIETPKSLIIQILF